MKDGREILGRMILIAQVLSGLTAISIIIAGAPVFVVNHELGILLWAIGLAGFILSWRLNSAYKHRKKFKSAEELFARLFSLSWQSTMTGSALIFIAGIINWYMYEQHLSSVFAIITGMMFLAAALTFRRARQNPLPEPPPKKSWFKRVFA